MRTKEPVITWDQILIKGAQLAKTPLNHDEPVSTTTVIGPNTAKPGLGGHLPGQKVTAEIAQIRGFKEGQDITSALIAIGCQQYRVCNTGRCPVGIATQDPELRRRLDIDRAAQKLENFLRVSTEELKDFARLTGHSDVHGLAVKDLCTTNSEISNHTTIAHV